MGFVSLEKDLKKFDKIIGITRKGFKKLSETVEDFFAELGIKVVMTPNLQVMIKEIDENKYKQDDTYLVPLEQTEKTSPLGPKRLQPLSVIDLTGIHLLLVLPSKEWEEKFEQLRRKVEIFNNSLEDMVKDLAPSIQNIFQKDLSDLKKVFGISTLITFKGTKQVFHFEVRLTLDRRRSTSTFFEPADYVLSQVLDNYFKRLEFENLFFTFIYNLYPDTLSEDGYLVLKAIMEETDTYLLNLL